jgi:hypothetical protein
VSLSRGNLYKCIIKEFKKLYADSQTIPYYSFASSKPHKKGSVSRYAARPTGELAPYEIRPPPS